jgi:hypothetical protein
MQGVTMGLAKKIVEDLESINEKSLTRIYQHTQDHDTGIITAERFAPDCGKGTPYTNKENKQRNKSLRAKLQSMRYGITSARGTYIENLGSDNEHEVGENAFFVVDLDDTGDLKKDLEKLGAEFEQDSILFMTKGGENAVLIGTNKCPDAYPGWKKVTKLGQRQIGKSGKIMTRVSGRPFIFENKVVEHALPQGYFGRLACKSVSEQHWEDIEL